MPKPTYTDSHQARALFCQVIQGFHQRGWALATSTNFSFRMEPNAPVWITASGRDKARLTPEDWLQVSLEGAALDAEAPKPSAETELHLDLYKQLPGTGAVAHTHSPAGTVLSRRWLEQGYVELEGFEMQKAFPGVKTHETLSRIPVVPNSQHMPDILATLHTLLQDPRFGDHPWASLPGYLIAGHGLYTWGADIHQAAHRIEALEFLLECLLHEAGS